MSILRRYSSKLPFAMGATVLGNMLQWFDFALFGLMLPLFTKLFFPEESSSIILFFLLFAVGSIARPIGGIVFGYVGDRLGRKVALVRTIFLMMIPLVLIGILPTYREIGALAPILLGLTYLFQGFCLGGEFPGSIVFLVEIAPPSIRGYIGSWAYFGPLLGMFFASIEIYGLELKLPQAFLETWGWRLPYLFGAVLGGLAIFLRRFLHETPIFQETKHQGHLLRVPLLDSLLKHKKMICVGIGVFTLESIGFNLIMIYSNYYYATYFQLSLAQIFKLLLSTVCVMLIFIPLGGKISIHIGSVRLARFAIWGFIIGAIPIYLLMLQRTLPAVVTAQFLLAAMLALYFCNMPAILFHLFPTSVRYTCCALVINGAVAIFGGTTPLFTTYFIKMMGPIFPGLYLVLGALVSLLSLNKLVKHGLVPRW